MPLQSPPMRAPEPPGGRRLARAGIAGAGIALAGIVLTVASCTSHPIIAAPPPTPPAPQRHLAAAIVVTAMLRPFPSSAGGCTGGSAALSGPAASPGLCYHQLGKPVAITSAAVSYQETGSPRAYRLLITVPAADRAELTAVTAKAADSRGLLDISVAGKTWSIPEVMIPLTKGQFSIQLQNRNQALQLQRMLVPPG